MYDSAILVARCARMSPSFCPFSVPLITNAWFSQKSYTTSDLIPLCLTLTCENQEAFNLVAVSHVIDVRLQKVMGFGKQAATIGPLSLMNRSSYHRTDLAARAHWEPDGHPTELPPDKEHPRSRWCIKLNGNLHRETKVELCPSYEGPGMAVMVRRL
jgi:hypothetical protein